MRKFIVAVLLCLMLSTLTGCALNDFVDSVKQGITGLGGDVADSDAKSKVKDLLSSGSFTDDTQKSMHDYLVAADAYKTACNTDTFDLGIGGRVWSFIQGKGFTDKGIQKKNIARTQANLQKTEGIMSAKVASDPLHLADIADSSDKGNKQNKSKTTKIVIIVVVVLLLLLLLFILNRRSNKPRVKAVKAQPVTQKEEVPERDTTSQLKANKLNACKKLADKYGVNVDDELAKCGGDVDSLYLRLVSMQPLDSDEE